MRTELPRVTAPRPPRLRREELREVMLSAGAQILREEGLANGGGSLTYAEVFRRFKAETGVKVSRAQVHGRIWNSVEDFRNEVLAHLAMYDASWESDALRAVAIEVLEGADLHSIQTRGETLRELIRQVSKANGKFINANPNWAQSSTIRSLQMVAAFHGATHGRIVDALAEAELVAEDWYLNTYLDISDVVGADVRTERVGMTYMEAARLLTKLLGSLGGAAGTRYSYFPDGVPVVEINLGPGGTRQEWDFLSIGQVALVEYFFKISESGVPGARETTERETTRNANGGHVSDPIDFTQPIPRDVLQRQLVATGAALIRERGLGHGAENLTYSRVFDRVLSESGLKVARAQIHGRIWDSQLDYQNDVLARLVNVDITPSREWLEEQMTAAVGSFDFTEHMDPLDLVEVMARAVRLDSIQMTTSLDWHLFCGVAKTQSLRDDPPATISANVAAAYERGTDLWTSFFGDLSKQLNVRVRPQLGIDRETAARIFGQIFDELVEGVAKRETILPGDLDDLLLQMPGSKEPKRWSGLAIGLLALTHFLYETEPATST